MNRKRDTSTMSFDPTIMMYAWHAFTWIFFILVPTLSDHINFYDLPIYFNVSMWELDIRSINNITCDTRATRSDRIDHPSVGGIIAINNIYEWE